MTEPSPKENFETMEDQSNKAADGASCTTPTIKISSFDCISIEGDLWDKKMEAFDSIAKSLPCNHLGMSESTSDIPIALQPLHPSPPTNHRTLNNGLNLECHSATDVCKNTTEDVSDIFPSSGNEDCLSTLSFPELSEGKQHKESLADQCHSAQCLNVKNEFGSRNGKDKLSKFQSLLSFGSTNSGAHSSIFGSAFFISSSKRGSASSLQRTNIVTEAQSLVPSIASEYFIDDVISNHEDLPTRHVFLTNNGDMFNSTSSYQDKLNSLERINGAIDDGNADGHFLKRSISMPPKYEYRNQTKLKITHVKEIFQDFLKKEDQEEPVKKEDVDYVADLRTTKKKEGKKKWKQTMPEIIEGPESETLTSQSSARMLLARTALSIMRGDYDRKSLKSELATCDEEMDEEAIIKMECKKYKKNLFVISLSFFFMFAAYLSLRNLQSSLNAAGGLGMYSLSSLYACFMVGCIFATSIVQRMRPKISMMFCTIGLFLYNLANFYPTFYTLIPASALVGFCLGVIWTAHATYLANMASGFSQLTGKKIQNVLSQFNGTFFLFYQSSQIIGGLISSLVLNNSSSGNAHLMEDTNGTIIPGNNSDYATDILLNIVDFNATYEHCGMNYCPQLSGPKSKSSGADPHHVYILMGIFTTSTVIGILILLLFLDRLEGNMKKSQASLPRQLFAVFSFFGNKKALCLSGLMLYSLVQSAFMFGEFTKSYITCTIGIHMVGYTMVCLSASSASCSYFNGFLQKCFGRCALVITAAILHSSMLITLLLWQPNPSETPVFFVIVAVWGIADGIILTQTISLIGLLFSENKEPAFAALKMSQSVANFVFFISSPYLCTLYKIIAIGSLLIFALGGYLTLEFVLRSNKDRSMIVIEKEVTLSNAPSKVNINEKENNAPENV